MPSAKSKVPAIPKSIACIHIDHLSLLLPMDKALKVMEALEASVRVDRDYDRGGNLGWKYIVRGQPEVEVSKVRPDQVVQPAADVQEPGQQVLRLR